jgi:hypothetical protein
MKERTNEKRGKYIEGSNQSKTTRTGPAAARYFFLSSSSLASTHFSRPVAFTFHSPHSKKKKREGGNGINGNETAAIFSSREDDGENENKK